MKYFILLLIILAGCNPDTTKILDNKELKISNPEKWIKYCNHLHNATKNTQLCYANYLLVEPNSNICEKLTGGLQKYCLAKLKGVRDETVIGRTISYPVGSEIIINNVSYNHLNAHNINYEGLKLENAEKIGSEYRDAMHFYELKKDICNYIKCTNHTSIYGAHAMYSEKKFDVSNYSGDYINVTVEPAKILWPITEKKGIEYVECAGKKNKNVCNYLRYCLKENICDECTGFFGDGKQICENERIQLNLYERCPHRWCSYYFKFEDEEFKVSIQLAQDICDKNLCRYYSCKEACEEVEKEDIFPERRPDDARRPIEPPQVPLLPKGMFS